VFNIFALLILHILKMGLAERKERERQELTDLILLKAKDIIAKEGVEKLSIRKIATEIEYSPATIYTYFQDKDELLYQMMNKGFELMASYIADVYEEPSPTKRIFMIGHSFSNFGIEHPDWYELMFHSANPMKHIQRCEAEWGHGIAIFEFLVATCQEAIKENKIKGWEARILALHLWSSMHGVICLHNSDRLCVVDHKYNDEGKRDMIDQVLEGIMSNIFKANL
jgi:AcrR family transcriptional regulator